MDPTALFFLGVGASLSLMILLALVIVLSSMIGSTRTDVYHHYQPTPIVEPQPASDPAGLIFLALFVLGLLLMVGQQSASF